MFAISANVPAYPTVPTQQIRRIWRGGISDKPSFAKSRSDKQNEAQPAHFAKERSDFAKRSPISDVPPLFSIHNFIYHHLL